MALGAGTAAEVSVALSGAAIGGAAAACAAMGPMGAAGTESIGPTWGIGGVGAEILLTPPAAWAASGAIAPALLV
jgi:hypothetical protein